MVKIPDTINQSIKKLFFQVKQLSNPKLLHNFEVPKKIIFTAILFSVVLPLFAADIVRDGKPCSAIIIRSEATQSAKMGAIELQYHVKLISGAELPIVNSVPPDVRTRIYIGDSGKYKSYTFKPQEYLLEVGGNDIYLAGRDDPENGPVDFKKPNTYPGFWKEKGSLYATYDLLEKLGVRWYLPTEIGICYTPTKNLSIPDIKIRRAPSFEFRDHLMIKIPTDLCGDTVAPANGSKAHLLDWRDKHRWYLRQRHGGVARSTCHTFYNYYKRFWPTHKEYFAQGRKPGKDMQLCYTNPLLIKQVIQDARNFLDGKMKNNVHKYFSNLVPDYESDTFPMGMMDNHRWCKCPRCQALIKGENTLRARRASEYWYTFVAAVANEIKKSHPDKFIAAQAYSAALYPPENVTLPDNVIITPALDVLTVSKVSRDLQQEVLKAWKTKYPKLKKYVHIWYCFPNFTAKCDNARYFPHFSSHRIKDYFQWFKDFGVKGMSWEPSYVHGGAGTMFDMVDGYINWKIAWNTSLDQNKLFDEFFEKFFGPASKPMRGFYLFAEQIYYSSDNYVEDEGATSQNMKIAWDQLGTSERMKKLGEYVAEAECLATAEPYKKRVAMFKARLWEYMLKGRADADRSRNAVLKASVNKDNLIKNPGFEEVGENNKAVGWKRLGTVVKGGFGGKCLKINVNVPQGKIFRSSSLNQKLGKKKPGRYAVSGMVKGNPSTMNFVFKGVKIAPVRIPAKKWRYIRDGWKMFSGQFVIPVDYDPEKAEIWLLFWSDMPEQILLDNACVQKLD